MQICQRCRRPTERLKVVHDRLYCADCYELVEEILAELREDATAGRRDVHKELLLSG